MVRRPLLTRLLPLGMAFALAACAHGKIPDTNIEDTEENRSVLRLVRAYEAAVESLDADAVLALVSSDFYEDNGNTDASDDYGYEGLAVNLRAGFERTRALQLALRIDAIDVEDDEAYAELYYEYRAKVEYPAGPRWDTGTDRFRLKLRRENEDDAWRIVSGL